MLALEQNLKQTTLTREKQNSYNRHSTDALKGYTKHVLSKTGKEIKKKTNQ